MPRSTCPELCFLRRIRASCVRNEPFGRRLLRFTCFACKASSAAGIASRAIGIITRLDGAGIAKSAIADLPLATTVARHKAIFFAEKNSQGTAIDYEAAVSGGLMLVPDGKALDSLSIDYARMVDDGLLLDEAEAFDELLEQCRELQERVNRGKSSKRIRRPR